jgi:hypothetical protein
MRFTTGNAGGNLISDGRNMHTRVDFDVAITAEGGGGAKGSLQVLSFGGIEAGGWRKSGYANRITFSACAPALEVASSAMPHRRRVFGNLVRVFTATISAVCGDSGTCRLPAVC